MPNVFRGASRSAPSPSADGRPPVFPGDRRRPGGIGARALTAWAIVLALIAAAAGAAWLSDAVRRPPQTVQTTVPPQSVQAQAIAPRGVQLGDLGANGLEKCRALRALAGRTALLQSSQHGVFTEAQRKTLDAQLAAAERRPPAALTPAQCGVPL